MLFTWYTFSYFCLFSLVVCLCLISCGSKNSDNAARIVLFVKSVGYDTYYLEQVGFSGEKSLLLDSALKDRFADTIYFAVPRKEIQLYEIRSSNSSMKIHFINDSKDITVRANYFTKSYSVEGSYATSNLKNFEDAQSQLAAQTAILYDSAEKLKSLNSPKLSEIATQFDIKYRELQDRYRLFADTVKNPAAFMRVYNNIDFGKDFQGLKNFITRASERFPGYNPVQKLKVEVIDYIKIFEEEYDIGDYLPELVLPDLNGKAFSTHSIKNKIILIDFWSTWCAPCIQYIEAKKMAKKIFPQDRFEIISIAIDAEKEAWRTTIERNHFNWPQLIDEKMWNGIAVKTIKFDSIPFNYLISTDGRILKKAIKPDSLIQSLSETINQIEQ